GISVWVSVVLDKFLYGRPSYRLVQDLADQGLALSMGTLTGGLQAIAPLFVPLYELTIGHAGQVRYFALLCAAWSSPEETLTMRS
ncbi:MAG TPA: hypothetical protein VET87_18875, partial [Rubrivivax sp.]|nr:hypothetical protein [Rubrivivax sp.]